MAAASSRLTSRSSPLRRSRRRACAHVHVYGRSVLQRRWLLTVLNAERREPRPCRPIDGHLADAASKAQVFHHVHPAVLGRMTTLLSTRTVLGPLSTRKPCSYLRPTYVQPSLELAQCPVAGEAGVASMLIEQLFLLGRGLDGDAVGPLHDHHSSVIARLPAPGWGHQSEGAATDPDDHQTAS